MKKLFMMVFVGAFSLMNAAAQEKFIDHLAVGALYRSTDINTGRALGYVMLGNPMDGMGIELTAQVYEWLEARVAFSMLVAGKGTETMNVEGVPGGKYVTGDVDVFHSSGDKSGSLFFDFYPFREFPLHFTAGTFVGSNSLLTISGKTPVPEALASYNTGVMEIHGLTIPTNKDGRIEGRVRTPAFKPCIGVGISTGRIHSRKVVFTADICAMYKGKGGMTIEAPDGSDVEVDYWRSFSEMSRLVAWNKKSPVAPLLTLRLTFRLF